LEDNEGRPEYRVLGAQGQDPDGDVGLVCQLGQVHELVVHDVLVADAALEDRLVQDRRQHDARIPGENHRLS
jgi:hypothetical protein